MIRRIIHTDEEKCNGCGLRAEACREGAVDIADGKAKLMRENFAVAPAIVCRTAPPEPFHLSREHACCCRQARIRACPVALPDQAGACAGSLF